MTFITPAKLVKYDKPKVSKVIFKLISQRTTEKIPEKQMPTKDRRDGLTSERQTDGHSDSSIPPNFIVGRTKSETTSKYSLDGECLSLAGVCVFPGYFKWLRLSCIKACKDKWKTVGLRKGNISVTICFVMNKTFSFILSHKTLT